MQSKEMLKLIDMKLPVEYRGDYRLLLEDVKLPKSRRLKVLEVLREILYEHITREKAGEIE